MTGRYRALVVDVSLVGITFAEYYRSVDHRFGDAAERLRRGDRIGATGRIEQDNHRTPKGWRVDHSVLIDQLDLPPKTTKNKEEQ